MKLKTTGIMLSTLFSLQVYAADTSHELLKNLDKLNFNILKTENALNKNPDAQKRADLEKMKFNLIEMKRLQHDFVDGTGLEKALSMAHEAGWSNTSAVLHRIQNACADLEKSQDGCFMEISEFEKFVSTRQITEAQKTHLVQLVNRFSKFSEARLVLSDEFLDQTYSLLHKYESIFTEASLPLVVVKMAPARVLPVTVPDVKKNYGEYLWATGALFALASALVYLRKSYKKKKQIKDFYGHIFMTSKKAQIKARIFGGVKPANAGKLNKLHRPYVDLLRSTSSFKANLEIKIKNRNKKMIIETSISAQKTIQEMISSGEHEEFSAQVEQTEKSLSGQGGEFYITNLFDGDGKLSKTYFTIEV